MAITSYGYDGYLDEVGLGRVLTLSGRDYAVGGAGDLAVTAVAGSGAREVDVAGGWAFGKGVADFSSASTRIALPAPPSGQTRYHTIVVHRDWQVDNNGVGGLSTVTSIPGGTTRTVATNMDQTLGVKDDQPLALCRVVSGQSVVAEVVDLRLRPARDVILFTSGSRPGTIGIAAVGTGQLGWEVDTGKLLAFSGASWVTVYEDTGWRFDGLVTDTTRWRSAGDAYDPRWRRTNGLTTVNMKLTRVASAYSSASDPSLIMTLPAAALPQGGREVDAAVCEAWGAAKVYIGAGDNRLFLDHPTGTIPVAGILSVHFSYPSN